MRNKKTLKIDKEKPFSNHEFKKNLGQNFLRDANLLKSIVADAGVTNEDFVVEVGAGAGTLTKEIAREAKVVVSYEVDGSLEPILREIERENKNLKIEFKDALKTENDEIFNTITSFSGLDAKTYKVVANIPYYITTPLLFKFLKDRRVTSITIMVQKEVAERIVSKEASGDYGSVTVMVNYYGVPEMKRIVKREMFYPSPKVDSAILKITKHSLVDYTIEGALEKVVKSAFSARRKMMINNLSKTFNIDKETLAGVMQEVNISPSVRAEELSVEEFITLSKKIEETRQI